MNFEQFYFINNTFDGEYKSSFPLFNYDALRESQIEELPMNFVPPQKVSDMVDEILYKKVKIDRTRDIVIPKKRGRKPIAKNGKKWDDPDITIQEIIENDLAGIPMESEIKMKEERLKNLREKKAQKKIEGDKGATIEVRDTATFNSFDLVPLNDEASFTPQIVLRDGKIVLETPSLSFGGFGEKKPLIIMENKKPYKLTSMSFRTKNTSAKWTPEETKKFYKAIEIFGADFSLIAKVFPTRNRDQIKNKFNKEEKTNSARINEAFKRNTTLSKRSLMDRIRNFSNSLNATENITPGFGEFDIIPGGIKALEKQYSNTSVDSMDLKIIDEIQEIFTNEIRNTRSSFDPLALTENSLINPQETTSSFEVPIITANEPVIKQQEAINKKKNLLLRLMS